MSISSLGVGSGLDLEGMVQMLMQVESRPLQMIATKHQSAQTKLSAYGMVQSAVANFQGTVKDLANITQYHKTSAGSSASDLATISANSSASNGSYRLMVNQLAQSQRLVAAGVESDKAALGAGKIVINFGEITGGVFNEATGLYDSTTIDGDPSNPSFVSGGNPPLTIDIKAENSSLADIRDAINAANAGLTATIVNDGSGNPFRLTISNSATGAKSSMQITVETEDDVPNDLKKLLTYDPGSDDPDFAQNMTQTQQALNSEFTLDGIRISKASNTVTDVIEGVTISLRAVSKDKDNTTTLSISRDTSAASKAAEDLVKAYNELSNTLKELTFFDTETKTGSILTGDSAVRQIQTALRNVFTQSMAGGPDGYRTLGDVGITFGKDGILEIDSSKLGAALAKDFDAFVGLFAEGGLSSNPAITFADAGAGTATGTFDVEITQVATKGSYSYTLASGQNALDMTGKSAADRTIQVTVNGVVQSVTLDESNYSATQLAAEMQSKINSAFTDAGVTVTAEGGVLKVTSGAFGSTSKVHLNATGLTDMLTDGTAVDGQDVAGTINGVAAVGNGQTLTGATGSAASGLKLTITGEENGIKGTVSFTKGFAFQFAQVADSMLGSGGTIQSRIDGLNTTLARNEKDYARMQERIDRVEQAYRRQFVALDVLLARLNQQSAYMTTQLQALSGLWQTSGQSKS